jgi:hypothetical protein
MNALGYRSFSPAFTHVRRRTDMVTLRTQSSYRHSSSVAGDVARYGSRQNRHRHPRGVKIDPLFSFLSGTRPDRPFVATKDAMRPVALTNSAGPRRCGRFQDSDQSMFSSMDGLADD